MNGKEFHYACCTSQYAVVAMVVRENLGYWLFLLLLWAFLIEPTIGEYVLLVAISQQDTNIRLKAKY